MTLKEWAFTAVALATVSIAVVPALAGSQPQGQTQPAAPAAAPASTPDAARQKTLEQSLPKGEGREELIAVCAGCHLLSVVTTQHKSEDGWTDVVISMRGRGADASDDDMEKIVRYLAANYGPPATPAKVNINSASATDIATALSLSDDQAKAIVNYRAQNGKFQDLAALKQVPGIDADKVDAAQDRIEF